MTTKGVPHVCTFLGIFRRDLNRKWPIFGHCQTENFFLRYGMAKKGLLSLIFKPISAILQDPRVDMLVYRHNDLVCLFVLIVICGTNLGDPSLKAKKASFGGLAGGFGPKSLRRGG